MSTDVNVRTQYARALRNARSQPLSITERIPLQTQQAVLSVRALGTALTTPRAYGGRKRWSNQKYHAWIAKEHSTRIRTISPTARRAMQPRAARARVTVAVLR